jgi:predicted nucleotidyltransferase
MKFGLTDETIHKINSVFEKYAEVDEVIIYGSRAKDNYREGSDIDITLKGKALTENIKSRIYNDIDELNTPYLFDISVFENIKADDLVEHINRVGQLFYKRFNSQS